ncbi:MAG: hypothetical protein IPM97_04400 [Bdellovibrionaceae bacterium]|nr:hypothetical protein [Pseudobdellovibrionaceae bacterium]
MKPILFLIISIFIASCATQPAKESPRGASWAKSQWETKAVVNDLKANKSHSLDIDILAQYPQNFRMEVSALLGAHVASFVLNGQEIKYTLIPQKKFFQGKASDASFLPIMNIPLHPINFMNVAYDRPLQGAGWICKNSSDGKVSECSQESRGIKVSWVGRTPEGQKKVLISGPTFEMRWLFRPPQTEVQFKDDTFRLEAPEEFKTIQLR